MQISMSRVRTDFWDSFALMQMSLVMAKLHWTYDLELVNKVDWEGQSRMHVMWWKPALNIRFSNAH